MWEELADYTRYRRANPSSDLTSAIVTSVLDGSVPSDDQVVGILWNLVAGGIDTTTSLVSWGCIT